jgi:mono/diheme cytochrome c family protein
MNFSRLIITGLFSAALSGMLAAQSTADLYKGKCQGCHGPDGHASGIGKKLGAKDFQEPDVAKMSRADLAKIISNGKNKMPAYKGKLTDDEIRSLAKYLKQMK